MMVHLVFQSFLKKMGQGAAHQIKMQGLLSLMLIDRNMMLLKRDQSLEKTNCSKFIFY